jgi:hypothetical protein
MLMAPLPVSHAEMLQVFKSPVSTRLPSIRVVADPPGVVSTDRIVE